MKQFIYMVIGLALLALGCKKEFIPGEYYPPPPLRFVMIDGTGTYLIKSQIQEVKMWYLVGVGGRNYVNLRVDSLYTPSKYGYQFLSTAFIGGKHKNYFLQIDKGKIDSIYYDVAEEPEFYSAGNYYYYSIREVRINGKVAVIEHDDGVYILKK